MLLQVVSNQNYASPATVIFQVRVEGGVLQAIPQQGPPATASLIWGALSVWVGGVPPPPPPSPGTHTTMTDAVLPAACRG